MRTTIALGEQYPIVREGIKAVLGVHENFSIIGETDNGLDAVKLAHNLKPDVLVVGVMLPGLNGLEVTRQVRKDLPLTHVVLLSRYADESYVSEALGHGVSGYVLKQASLDELVQAVCAAARGQRYLSRALPVRLAELQTQGALPGVRPLSAPITPREREVLSLVSQGRTNSEIAITLGISPRTVESHRSHLMQKLGLRTQADLIRYALQRGLAPEEA